MARVTPLLLPALTSQPAWYAEKIVIAAVADRLSSNRSGVCFAARVCPTYATIAG